MNIQFIILHYHINPWNNQKSYVYAVYILDDLETENITIPILIRLYDPSTPV